MNDFIRPFSDAEFKKACLSAGYPEIAWRYCHEKWQECFDDILRDNLSAEDLPELKEHAGWTSDNIREQAWTDVKEYSHVDTYVQQRELGHGHEWSRLFCKILAHSGVDAVNIYWATFVELQNSRIDSGEEVGIKHDWFDCLKQDTLSCREYVLAVKNIAKGEGEIVERYIGNWLGSMREGYEGNTDDLLLEAKRFRTLHEKLLSEGYYDEDAFGYALDLFDEHYPVFNEIYREAMRHGSKRYDAWALADFCENAVVNGWLLLEKENFKNKFTESWQREIYAGLVIKDWIQDEGSISTLHENEIRKSLDLSPIDKPLAWEDEEFLRLKKEYIKSGLNEFAAEQRYKDAYGNYSDIELDSIRNNRSHDIKRDMLEMMFPNDDIDSEDFEDGLDFEDMND